MRKLTTVTVAVSLLLLSAGFAAADDQQDAMKIVERGLKAAGGKALLTKFNAMTWEETGKYYGMGDGLPYTGKYALQWPHQFRMEIVDVFVIVLNKDKGWVTGPDGLQEMDEETLAEQKENHYSGWVSSLVPLSDKGFKLATIGEAEVDGKATVGVKVSHDGHRDVNLRFDKESGLLVKVEATGKSPEFGDKMITKDTILSNYKEIDGVKVPMKVVMKFDGKLFVEAELSNYKLHEKLDEKTFGKPAE